MDEQDALTPTIVENPGPDALLEGAVFAPGARRCVATTNAGTQCRQVAMVGTDYCRTHGGEIYLAQTGVGNVNFRHGRYSKLPKSLLSRYMATENDPELLSLNEEIRLIDGLISEAADYIDAGPDEALWKQLSEQVLAFKVGLQTKDHRKQAAAFAQITDLARRGTADASNRKQMRELVQERRKLVESEMKRLIAMQAMLGADEAMVLMMKMIAIIKESVPDKGVRRVIIAKIQQLMAGKEF